MMNNPSVSQEELEYLKKNKVRKLLSPIPSDKYDCDCSSFIREWQDKLAKGSKEIFRCPRAKGMKKFEIICGECGEKVAEVSAVDKTLKDWCDLHYYSESRLKRIKEEKNYKYVGKWFGCLGLQISPKDDKLGIECACGNDTRDFRVKSNLTGQELKAKLINNMEGRDFGLKNSKFILKEVKNG